MSPDLLPSQPAPTESGVGVETLIRRFEADWLEGKRPNIDDFLGRRNDKALLLELAHAELELRLKAGEPARVDDYLNKYPDLAADSQASLGLIVAEYRLRRKLEPTLTAKDFAQRFPEYRDDLAVRLSDAPLSETVAGAPVPSSEQGANLSGTMPETNPTATAAASPRWPHVEGYEILGELGRGGMGVVYKARHLELRRTVALKMILTGGHAASEEVARFRTEAEAVARLQHPNVVQIHDIGEHQGLPYFSLEFCSGGSLAGRLGGTPQPPRRAAALVETLARAIHAAHQTGIVHRDLKPANVLLATPADLPADQPPGQIALEQLVPKITDFGLAKKLDDPGQTRSGAIMGTPSYMSPEQCEGRVDAIGPATDVYALAAILYEMTTGKTPFKGATSWDTIEQVRTQEPVKPRQLQPNLPRDLETICLKGLRKAPGQRYASARDLADDLRRWQDGQPIKARPTSAWERGWKWARRRPAAAGLLGVAVLAACASVAALALYARSQSQQADIAKQELKRNQEQEEVREHSSRTLLRAQQYEAAENWADANTELVKAQESLYAQPDLLADELRRKCGTVWRRSADIWRRRRTGGRRGSVGRISRLPTTTPCFTKCCLPASTPAPTATRPAPPPEPRWPPMAWTPTPIRRGRRPPCWTTTRRSSAPPNTPGWWRPVTSFCWSGPRRRPVRGRARRRPTRPWSCWRARKGWAAPTAWIRELIISVKSSIRPRPRGGRSNRRGPRRPPRPSRRGRWTGSSKAWGATGRGGTTRPTTPAERCCICKASASGRTTFWRYATCTKVAGPTPRRN